MLSFLDQFFHSSTDQDWNLWPRLTIIVDDALIAFPSNVAGLFNSFSHCPGPLIVQVLMSDQLPGHHPCAILYARAGALVPRVGSPADGRFSGRRVLGNDGSLPILLADNYNRTTNDPTTKTQSAQRTHRDDFLTKVQAVSSLAIFAGRREQRPAASEQHRWRGSSSPTVCCP